MLHSQKISTAMPIQEEAIPHVLTGKDIVAIAQTGTGKTLAFGLPSLTKIAENPGKGIQKLVICPTRELAEQIYQVLNPLARNLNLSCTCVYGGVGIRPQVMRLRANPSIVVATPGRLLDHLNRGNVQFKNLQVLTLDEADRMLDMGFLPDIKRIISYIPKKRQTLLFSATFPESIQSKLEGITTNPVRIEIAPQSTTAENVTQGVYPVIAERKSDLLAKLLQQPEVVSTLVFTRTKIRADRVKKRLRVSGFQAESIHGGCTQNQRLAAIKKFKNGQCNILVATDIAARGIDIKGVTHVINYDVPFNSEDYVHRIGRTARAKAEGTAYTFVSPGEESSVRSIEKTIGKGLFIHEWEGMATLSKPKSRSSSTSGSKPRRKRNKPRTNEAANFKPNPPRSRKKRQRSSTPGRQGQAV